MMQLFRDSKTPYGGLIRFWFDGRVQVLRRDFGLTTEPECSEAAHRQAWKWFCEHEGIPYDPTMFPDDPSVPPVPPMPPPMPPMPPQ